MIIGEETVAIVVVIRLIRVAVTMTEGNVTIAVVTETAAETGGVGMTISAKRPKMKKVTTEREATRIIITGMTGGIVIATGTTGTETAGRDAEIAAIAMNGTGDTPGTTGKIDIETSVRAITRRGIARDRDRDRGTAHHRYRLGR